MNCEIIAPYSDEREKVLRNTYSLLAVSLLPTVLGAYIGLHFDVLKMLGGAWNNGYDAGYNAGIQQAITR